MARLTKAAKAASWVSVGLAGLFVLFHETSAPRAWGSTGHGDRACSDGVIGPIWPMDTWPLVRFLLAR
jgi:hypothetical protein